MDRQELEQLSRNELVTLAHSAGVSRADTLTRAELVDELLRGPIAPSPKRARARGLVGKVRELLATIVERGLHLPETAERIRHVPPKSWPDAPAPLSTVTLAEIYIAQGHPERALTVLDEVLAREPDHVIARTMRTRLLASQASSSSTTTSQQPPAAIATQTPRSANATSQRVKAPNASAAQETDRRKAPQKDLLTAVPAASPLEPPEEKASGPIRMLDDEPLPERYDVDEAVVMPVDPTTAYLYWEVRFSTVDRMRSMEPHGRLVVRLTAVTASSEGPTTSTRDIVTDALVGDYFVYGLPEGAILRSAVGWLVGDTFHALAEGPAYAAPPASPSALLADTLVRWSLDASLMVVVPPPASLALSLARGELPSDIEPSPIAVWPAAQAGEEASSGAILYWKRVTPPFGSSEHWVPVRGAFPQAPRPSSPMPSSPMGASDLMTGMPSSPMGASDLMAGPLSFSSLHAKK